MGNGLPRPYKWRNIKMVGINRKNAGRKNWLLSLKCEFFLGKVFNFPCATD